MIEQTTYQNFKNLSNNKKFDYLYTLLVEKDTNKLKVKYSPETAQVYFDEKLIVIITTKLKTAREIKNSMIMDGMLLFDERYWKEDGLYNVSYYYEGAVAPICLN